MPKPKKGKPGKGNGKKGSAPNVAIKTVGNPKLGKKPARKEPNEKPKKEEKSKLFKKKPTKPQAKPAAPSEKQIHNAIEELSKTILENKEDYRKAVDTYFAENKSIDLNSVKTRILKGVIAKFSTPSAKVVAPVVEKQPAQPKAANAKVAIGSLKLETQSALNRIKVKVADFEDNNTPLKDRTFWVTSPDENTDAEILGNSPNSFTIGEIKREFGVRYIKMVAADTRPCFVPDEIEMHGRFRKVQGENGEYLERISGTKLVADCGSDDYEFGVSETDPNIAACFKKPDGKALINARKNKK